MMKTLTKYLNEKLVIFPSQVDEKSSVFPSQVDEKLVINKNYKSPYTCAPKSFEELRKVIEDRYNKLGPGTEKNPIDFNDIDVSNMVSFYNKKTYSGIFDYTFFKYIDISDWDVSNVTDMSQMFKKSNFKKNISKWDVRKVIKMNSIFKTCIIRDEYKPHFH